MLDDIWLREVAKELFNIEIDGADAIVLLELIFGLRKLVSEMDTVKLSYLDQPFIAPGRDTWLEEWQSE